jgi:hypothetical protein
MELTLVEESFSSSIVNMHCINVHIYLYILIANIGRLVLILFSKLKNHWSTFKRWKQKIDWERYWCVKSQQQFDQCLYSVLHCEKNWITYRIYALKIWFELKMPKESNLNIKWKGYQKINVFQSVWDWISCYKIMEMETLFTRWYINHLTFKHINILTLI